jgi:hypothetical protein
LIAFPTPRHSINSFLTTVCCGLHFDSQQGNVKQSKKITFILLLVPIFNTIVDGPESIKEHLQKIKKN